MDTDKDRIDTIQNLVDQFLLGKEYSSIATKINSITANTRVNTFFPGTLDNFLTILSKPLIYQVMPDFFNTFPIPQKNDTLDCCSDSYITLRINETHRSHHVRNERVGIVYQFVFILINHLINKKNEVEDILEFADSLLLDTCIIQKSVINLEDIKKIKISTNPIPIYFDQILQGRYNPERILSTVSIFNDDKKKIDHITRLEKELIKIQISYYFLKNIITSKLSNDLNKALLQMQQTISQVQEHKSLLQESIQNAIPQKIITSQNQAFLNFNQHFQIKPEKQQEVFKIFDSLKSKGRIDFNNMDNFITITANEAQGYVSGLIDYLEEKEYIPLKKRGIVSSIIHCFRWKAANNNINKYNAGTLKNYRTPSKKIAAKNEIAADLLHSQQSHS